ncbi:MAG: hypothetical protein ACJAYA_001269 [Bacteroidia bacterium]|jgi:hypothetical protein
MKKTLLSILTIAGLGAFSAYGQTFAPIAMQGLPDGTVGEAYSEMITVSDLPATTTVSLATLGLPSQLLNLLPAGAPSTATLTVTSIIFTAEDLASGLSSTSPSILAGASGAIDITGTPVAEGISVVNITSSTLGSADLTAVLDAAESAFPGAGLIVQGLGISNPFPVPAPVPGLFDEDGYDLEVTGSSNSIAESNEVFSLGLYPNPTEGVSTLDINSTVAGTATVEIYSITGSLVQTSVKPIRVGANRLPLDFTSVPAGIYLVKADINGSQALVRTQKK